VGVLAYSITFTISCKELYIDNHRKDTVRVLWSYYALCYHSSKILVAYYIMSLVSGNAIITLCDVSVQYFVIVASSLDGMKGLVAETAIMKSFHHPNVLPLLGVCVDHNDDDVLKIVIPFMAHGDLRTFLKKSRVSLNNTHEYPKVKFTLKFC